MQQTVREFLELVFHGVIGILFFKALLTSPPHRLTNEEKLLKKIKRQGAMINSLQNQAGELAASEDVLRQEHQQLVEDLQKRHAEEIKQHQKQYHLLSRRYQEKVAENRRR